MLRTSTALLLAAAAFVGCENTHSRLDEVATVAPKITAPSAAPVNTQADHTGDVEARLRRLEDNYAKYAEALEFLGKVYAQQKAQQAQQEAEEPDPTAVFAVAVNNDIQLRQGRCPGERDGHDRQGVRLRVPVLRARRVDDGRAREGSTAARSAWSGRNTVVHPQVATPAAPRQACAAAKQ
ncbi:MAG: hypothetical protein IPQ07_16950 [Myxococcales bacterium]|nr:hypothetical protein [Myxococcales bacterium]